MTEGREVIQFSAVCGSQENEQVKSKELGTLGTAPIWATNMTSGLGEIRRQTRDPGKGNQRSRQEKPEIQARDTSDSLKTSSPQS